MATILSQNLKVKNGQLIVVKNEITSKSENQGNQAKEYIAVWVINEDNNDEIGLMFTKNEILKLKSYGGTLVKDLKLGKLYTFGKILTEPKYIIAVNDIKEEKHILILNKKLFEKVKNRWNKNVEDQPEKSWLTNYIFEEFAK